TADDVTFHWDRVGKLTYPCEWPAEGWRAAARVGLRALQVLRGLGLTLRAPQLGDVFMVGSTVTLANLGVVMPWSACVEARTVGQIDRQFSRPTECAARGKAGLARRPLRGDGLAGLSAADRDTILGQHSAAPRPASASADALGWLDAITFPLQSASGET